MYHGRKHPGTGKRYGTNDRLTEEDEIRVSQLPACIRNYIVPGNEGRRRLDRMPLKMILKQNGKANSGTGSQETQEHQKRCTGACSESIDGCEKNSKIWTLLPMSGND
jgi:hypothetical protein